jgi:hypothetical protein
MFEGIGFRICCGGRGQCVRAEWSRKEGSVRIISGKPSHTRLGQRQGCRPGLYGTSSTTLSGVCPWNKAEVLELVAGSSVAVRGGVARYVSQLWMQRDGSVSIGLQCPY